MAVFPSRPCIKPRISESVKWQICDLYLKEWSYEEISSYLNVSVTSIRRVLQKAAIPTGRGIPTKFRRRPEIRARILHAFNKGASVAALTKIYDCDKSSIVRVLKDFGIERSKISKRNNYTWIDRRGRLHEMRSSWEVLVGVYLDSLESRWNYEYEAYTLSRKNYYLPDFVIFDENNKVSYLVEVKGLLREKNKIKLDRFRQLYPHIRLEVWDKSILIEKGILNTTLPESAKRSDVKVRTRLPKKTQEMILTYYTKGLTYTEISKRTGHDIHTVSKLIKIHDSKEPV